MNFVKTNIPAKKQNAPPTNWELKKIAVFCKSHVPARILRHCNTPAEAMLCLSVGDMLTLLLRLGYVDTQNFFVNTETQK